MRAPSYIDHFMYKGQLCIITEFCEAGDMQALLRRRAAPLTEQQVLDYLAQLALALQHVHAAAVLHRDLKTQNVFLTADNTVKLGDFGIARSLDGTHDLASTVIGAKLAVLRMRKGCCAAINDARSASCWPPAPTVPTCSL